MCLTRFRSCAHVFTAVEDFKKDLLSVTTGGGDTDRLHSEACRMYRLFVDPRADDQVELSDDLLKQFQRSKGLLLSSCVCGMWSTSH